jgi:hypothetical protein
MSKCGWWPDIATVAFFVASVSAIGCSGLSDTADSPDGAITLAQVGQRAAQAG